MIALIVIGVSVGILEFLLRIIDNLRSDKTRRLGFSAQNKGHYEEVKTYRKDVNEDRKET